MVRPIELKRLDWCITIANERADHVVAGAIGIEKHASHAIGAYGVIRRMHAACLMVVMFGMRRIRCHADMVVSEFQHIVFSRLLADGAATAAAETTRVQSTR